MIAKVLPTLFATMLLSSAASAQSGNDIVSAEILPGWREADGTHMAGLRLTLAPGWKTFWRAPGDAGIPPRFDVSDSENVGEMRTIWPRPDVFDVSGLRSVGYKREVVLPIEIAPENTDAPVQFEGRVEIGICSDVCVPATLNFTAELPPDGASDARIVAALVDVPFTAEEAGVQRVDCAIAPVQYGLGLRAEISLPQMKGRETVVVESPDPMIWVSEPKSWWEGDVLVTETEMSHIEQKSFSIDESDLRFTVISDGIAVDIQGCDTR